MRCVISGIFAFCSSVSTDADGAARFVDVVPVAVVVDREQRLDALLHRLRQVVVRGLLVGEQRVAADLRHDPIE